jgi:hypothetical protein
VSAALYLWVSLTVGWNGSVQASAGPSVVLRRYSESLDATRLQVELAPCTLSIDDDATVRFESSVESSILAAAREQP